MFAAPGPPSLLLLNLGLIAYFADAEVGRKFLTQYMDGRKEKLTAGYSCRFRDMKKSSSYIFILKENETSMINHHRSLILNPLYDDGRNDIQEYINIVTVITG